MYYKIIHFGPLRSFVFKPLPPKILASVNHRELEFFTNLVSSWKFKFSLGLNFPEKGLNPHFAILLKK